MTCTGDGPGGQDRPAHQDTKPDPAKVISGRARASVAQGRCDRTTYCTACQLWPLRASLIGTWRTLEHAA